MKMVMGTLQQEGLLSRKGLSSLEQKKWERMLLLIL
jgi:hypothetical protein